MATIWTEGGFGLNIYGEGDWFLDVLPDPTVVYAYTYLRPSADISTGAWTPSTGSTLYGVLDEIVPDDADYIQTLTASSCEVQLSASSPPPTRDNHTINYRLLAGSGIIVVTLKCGSTTIKSWNHTLTGSVQGISQTLTNAEASSITNYADLRVAFTAS